MITTKFRYIFSDETFEKRKGNIKRCFSAYCADCRFKNDEEACRTHICSEGIPLYKESGKQ